MTVLNRITEAGEYPAIAAAGENRNDDIGLLIDVWGDEPVVLPSIELTNVFIPIIKKGDAPLIVDGDTHLYEFGGDAANFLNSNIHFQGEYNVRNNTPTRPYDMLAMEPGEGVAECLYRHGVEVYDPDLLIPVEYPRGSGQMVLPSYHCDVVFQAYAVDETGYRIDPNGVIENIIMPNIDAEISGDKCQAIMGSEANCYKNMHLGTEKLRIISDGYPYSIVFNTMESSYIGGADVEVEGIVKIKNVKGSTWDTGGIVLDGFTQEQLDIPQDAFILNGEEGHEMPEQELDEHDQIESIGLSEEELQAISSELGL